VRGWSLRLRKRSLDEERKLCCGLLRKFGISGPNDGLLDWRFALNAGLTFKDSSLQAGFCGRSRFLKDFQPAGWLLRQEPLFKGFPDCSLVIPAGAGQGFAPGDEAAAEKRGRRNGPLIRCPPVR